jgi:DNA-binding MarR family transcriptional regulator
MSLAVPGTPLTMVRPRTILAGMAQKILNAGPDPAGILGQIARIRESVNLLIEEELRLRGIVGIVPAHGPVLHFLFRQNEAVPIKSLVEESGRVKSTVTGIVNTLERHGYISKQGCDQDARSVRIALTEKGRGVKHDFEEISRLVLGRCYGEMPEEERGRLVELLCVIEENLKR